MIYQRIIHELDDDGRLRVDAILGDETAIAEMRAHRRATLMAADVEIG